jgi:hypothetical protein
VKYVDRFPQDSSVVVVLEPDVAQVFKDSEAVNQALRDLAAIIQRQSKKGTSVMTKQHDRVVLTEDVPEEGLTVGDVGTVVYIHNSGEGYEVEFITLTGQTIAVASLLGKQVRPVSRHDLSHVRELQPA